MSNIEVLKNEKIKKKRGFTLYIPLIVLHTIKKIDIISIL